MKLSAKMPAQMDSTLAAKMADSMPSDSQKTGDGGSNDAPVTPIVRDSSPTVEWQSLNDNKPGWEATDGEFNSKGWEVTDRKDENNEGAMPQRDPDNDGDLN